jgi:hypothetical protein
VEAKEEPGHGDHFGVEISGTKSPQHAIRIGDSGF